MGYGDIYPRTEIGKVIIFLCSLVGVIVISLMVVAVTTKLEMTNLQSKAYTVIARADARDKVKLKAANAITKACKIYLKIKKDVRIPVSTIFDLNKTLMEFKKMRRLVEII